MCFERISFIITAEASKRGHIPQKLVTIDDDAKRHGLVSVKYVRGNSVDIPHHKTSAVVSFSSQHGGEQYSHHVQLDTENAIGLELPLPPGEYSASVKFPLLESRQSMGWNVVVEPGRTSSPISIPPPNGAAFLSVHFANSSTRGVNGGVFYISDADLDAGGRATYLTPVFFTGASTVLGPLDPGSIYFTMKLSSLLPEGTRRFDLEESEILTEWIALP